MKPIIIAALPRTASNYLKEKVEAKINSKAINLKSEGGLGHFYISRYWKPLIYSKIKVKINSIFRKKNLFYQHFLPTKNNKKILSFLFGEKKSLEVYVTYRNIFQIFESYFKTNKSYLGNKSYVNHSNSIKILDIYNIIFQFDFWVSEFNNNKDWNIKFINFNDIISDKINFEDIVNFKYQSDMNLENSPKIELPQSFEANESCKDIFKFLVQNTSKQTQKMLLN